MGSLRLLLAICVVEEHVAGATTKNAWFLPGGTAVQAFFILSGFYMALVLNGHYRERPAADFWASRYLRLYPAYLVFALAELIFQFGDKLRHLLEKAPWDTLLFIGVSNLTLFGKDLNMFLKATWSEGGHLAATALFHQTEFPPLYHFILVPPSWTISMELAFYLIAPLFLRSPARTLLVFAAALTLRFSLAAFGLYEDPWYYRFLPSELLLFAAGALAFFVHQIIDWQARRTLFRALGLGGGAILLYLALSPAPLVPDAIAAFIEADLPQLAFQNYSFLVLTALCAPFLFQVSKASRFDKELGDWSYIFYVGHFFFLVAFKEYLDGIGLRLAVLGSLLLVSPLLVRVLEQPVGRLRARWFGARA